MSRKLNSGFKKLLLFSSVSLFLFLLSLLFSKKIPFFQVRAHIETDCEQWDDCCDKGHADCCCPRPTRTPTPTPLSPTPSFTPTPTLTSTPTPTDTPVFQFTPTPTPETEITPTPTATEGESLKLTLAKTNDKQNGASPGDSVKYTLILSDISLDLTAMSLIDNLPEGFSYQSGSGGVSGGSVSSTEPALTNSGKTLTWNWHAVPALTSVTVTYTAKISDDNKAATYTDFAWAKGLAGEIPAESNIVWSDVTVNQSFSYSAAVGGSVLGVESVEGEVLGAVLPATGMDNNGYLSVAFFMIGIGLFIKKKISLI